VTPLADAGARERIRTELDRTFVVEAAAGTGKTTELVARIVAVVESGVRLREIVAVTFTDKAAGELRLRLRSVLESRLRTAGETARSALIRAIDELEVAHIGTIHSLCSDLLRERPIEARIDPQFQTLNEDQAYRLYARAFDQWFQTVLADPPPGVRRVLRTREGNPRDLLADAGLSLVDHRDHPAPWRRDPWDRDQAIELLRNRLRPVAALSVLADDPRDELARALGKLADVLQELDDTDDLDRIESALRLLVDKWWWNDDGHTKRAFSKKANLTRAFVLSERDQAYTLVEAFSKASQHDLAALLHAELQGVVATYEHLKDERGALDFVDLLVATKRLLQESRSVRTELQARIRRLFVDEFQDTDPLQVEIVFLLAASDPDAIEWRACVPESGKLFIVGDPKQSIYRFRRAEVRLYEDVKKHLAAHGADVLHLTTSFRSRPAIQAVVNQAFHDVMQGAPDDSQATYVALSPYREDAVGMPSIVALPCPRAYNDYRRRAQWNLVTQHFPATLAGWIRWLLDDSGWKVEDQGSLVPVASRHVCILFRRFRTYRDEDIVGPYVKALEAYAIPHVLVGGAAYHQREEIEALRTALAAIEWPDDELRVYGALRGPFFGHTDEELFTFRERHRTLHPLTQFSDPPGGVAATLELLGSLHMQRNARPIASTIVALLEATRAHAGFANWSHGEQTLANVLKLVEMAQAFEAEGATSFRLFVEELDAQARDATIGEAAVVEEGTDGVRLTTVHRAKGLEFPIVVLCDPTKPFESTTVSRYADSDRHAWYEKLAGCAPAELDQMESTVLVHDNRENVRLAYVAATRARDVLVVPTVQRGSMADRWAGLLWKAVLPLAGSRAEPAPGCPPFSQPDADDPSDDSPIVAGLHHAANAFGDPIPVVYWDPSILPQVEEAERGLRAVDFLIDPKDGSDDGRAAYETWKANERELRTTAAKPQRVVRSVSELVQERGPSSTANIAHERVALRAFQRPGGTRFGSLVHAVLAEVPLDAGPDRVADHARVQARLLAATPEETEAAIAAVLAALAHAVFVDARAAHEVRREVPLQVRLPDGVLAEGVVDLAYRDASGWVVVDFKTDADPALRREEYERQVALYIFALRRATAGPVRGVLLTV
jgi:ATP-dependent helicase/nuclease subunit A